MKKFQQTRKFTDKDVEDFSSKIIEAYNKVVPKWLRENKDIDKDREKSYSEWIERLRNKLGLKKS